MAESQSEPNAEAEPAAGTASDAPRRRTPAEYRQFLEEQRKTRGEPWYKKKVAEMEARDAAYKKRRDASWTIWRSRVHEWSVGGGFDAIVSRLLGAPYRRTGSHLYFRVGPSGVKFDVDVSKHTCARWDGNEFANGKKGSREALGVAKCFFELNGAGDPSREAWQAVAEISGIHPDDVEITPDVERKIAQARNAAAEAAEKRRLEDEREDPLTPAEIEELPVRIDDPRQIEQLTRIMAKERAFPLQYAKRLVAEGTIWFGTFRYRDSSGIIQDTGRPIACSNVTGFETGQLMGVGGREIKQFFSREEGKGKNSGRITKGAVFIGNWSDKTRRIVTLEGVYDAAALRHIRERSGLPLASDECFVVMTGSRMPEKLIRICQERGISITAAVDADRSGNELVEDAAVKCASYSVPFKAHQPTMAEFTWEFADDEWGRAAYVDVARELRAGGIRFCLLPAGEKVLRLVSETSPAATKLLTQYSVLERASAPKAASEDDESPRRLVPRWHRKDWNELLQRTYRQRAATTAGIPAADPNLEAQFKQYLAACGLSADDAAALRTSLLTYPALIDGRPVAVWVGVDPSSRSILAYHTEALDGTGTPENAGATWRVGMCFGNPATSASVIVGQNAAAVVKAWRDAGPNGFAVLSFCPGVPEVVAEVAKTRAIPVSPAGDGGDMGLAREAQLAAWARKVGLAYRSVAAPDIPPMPSAPVSVAAARTERPTSSTHDIATP